MRAFAYALSRSARKTLKFNVHFGHQIAGLSAIVMDRAVQNSLICSGERRGVIPTALFHGGNSHPQTVTFRRRAALRIRKGVCHAGLRTN